MQIKLVSDYQYVGGVWVHVAYLAKALGTKGASVKIITNANPNVNTAELNDARKYDQTFYNSLAAAIETVHAAKDSVSLEHMLMDCELLHLHATFSFRDLVSCCGRVARNLKLPYIVTLHTMQSYRNVRDIIAERELVETLENSKKIIAVSDGVKSSIEKLGIDTEHIEVIPNGVDSNVFRPLDKISCRKELGLQTKGNIVLYVGRLVYEKGADLLVELTKKSKELDFVILGYGEFAKYLQSNNVTLLHYLPRTKMPLIYSAADVLILPSRTEGMPLVILEALACGTPVVASSIPGNNEIVDCSVGRLSGHSITSFYKKIYEVLSENKDLSLSKAARNKAKKYSWTTIADKTMQIYQNAKR